ncbi:hypothetical protein TcasGA2_TC000909 [Tribolium castaneum]|uniref:Uncharacterized protein n=1 Tax=Tribolium castaneum TaxID=7070 RepID=D6W927_TRICA|nr:hypothetical protein TcasGA2_TC000909 [Tribolium castaneum]
MNYDIIIQAKKERLAGLVGGCPGVGTAGASRRLFGREHVISNFAAPEGPLRPKAPTRSFGGAAPDADTDGGFSQNRTTYWMNCQYGKAGSEQGQKGKLQGLAIIVVISRQQKTQLSTDP